MIIDRYKNPNNMGKLRGGVEAEEANMLCGDKLKIYLKLKKIKL